MTTGHHLKLHRISGEFTSAALESAYWQFSWEDARSVTRTSLLVIAFICMVFFIVDIMALGHQAVLYWLLAGRLLTLVALGGTAAYIHRAARYFGNYPYLVLAAQIWMAITIWLLAILRQMPTAYLGVNTILLTLIFYQFLNGRFAFTVGASIFMGIGSMAVGFSHLQMLPTELIGSFFFLVPINFLGIAIMRSNNRSKRREYMALVDAERIHQEKEKLIEKLQSALAEVRTLQGFLPICAHCHKIRDDKGYWERIEKYIQDRTQARFSHSLCPECSKTLYAQFLKEPP
jgi:hypothetical protein